MMRNDLVVLNYSEWDFPHIVRGVNVPNLDSHEKPTQHKPFPTEGKTLLEAI